MPDNLQRKKKLIFLIITVAIACVLCYLIARPFAQPILTAAILAVLVHPLFLRLRKVTGNRNWAAFLFLSCLLFVLAGLLTLLAFSIEREVVATHGWFTINTAARDGWTSALSSWTDTAFSWLGVRFGIAPDVLRTAAFSRLNQASSFVLHKAGDLLASIGTITVAVVLTLLTLFYFLREGSQLLRRGANLVPLTPAQKEQLINEIKSSIEANVIGVLLVAAAQALLLGIGFWFLGVPSPVLWALVTGGCSMVPFFGAALVWVPGAVYLLVTGSWVKALILVGWGAGIVSLSDNIIRPWVVGERLKLSPIILFFALLGGLDLFGPLGIFLGPLIVSTAFSLAKMLRQEVQTPAASPDASHPLPD